MDGNGLASLGSRSSGWAQGCAYFLGVGTGKIGVEAGS